VPARPERSKDPRLERLLFLVDGVYAIALTLLAIELALPASAEGLEGQELLHSLLDIWPKFLSFLTSFTVIANFWVGQLMIFQYVRRFDGRLMWLALTQLLCVAFLPFPTAVLGEHVSDRVAQEFYFGSLTIAALTLAFLWWYASAGRRLVASDIDDAIVHRTHVISWTVASALGAMVVLVALGVGRLVNPLVLGYAFVAGTTVLGIIEGGGPLRGGDDRS
jgi:uncharacterized membrane protein